MGKSFKLMVAPLQGLTEAAWRSVHFSMFGEIQGDVEYFTPFIRVEKGVVRPRDLRDYTSPLNRGVTLTPQIIFRDVEEWKVLVDTLAEAGASRIDMNLGCPFVPQVRKGRGAGLLSRTDVLEEISAAMRQYAGSIEFSVKMRLGVEDPSEAIGLTEILNDMPLRHVAVHPRTARQQYKGELLMTGINMFTSGLHHPVIFNGGVTSPSDIVGLSSQYAGVMAGRGLLARPSLFAEYRSGCEYTDKEREDLFLKLIEGTGSVLGQRLCGAAQLRDKMKPYWDYAPASIHKKIVKTGKKNGLIM
ncbi:MAG: tRNA-dihydrouridine synthase family protein [Muribaculaceae bacterium]|nr:tRNA-dihydrouridine synthase family protein [Muribaculaceae bacterium]